MASTYSTNLAIELIGTGDQAGTWGVTTNTNLGTLIEQAISGYVTQAVSTGSDTTITIPNGATGVARNMYIELTGTGGTNTNLIVPSNKKLYFIFNNTSSGQVTVKVSGQTGVSVPNGKKMILVCNGTDIVNGLNYIADFGTNSFTVTNLTASSGTITNLIATTGTITTLSATSGNISNLVSSDASATVLRAGSATLTHLSATSASITNLALTSLTISSLSITNVSVASATVSSNLTLSGGTANGVLYLNGSKVATSGSALTFDGTTFQLSRSSGDIVLNDTSGSTSIRFLTTGGVNYLQTGGSTSGTYAPLAFTNRGGTAEYMRLTDTGLGIGTASPAADGVQIARSGTPQIALNRTGSLTTGSRGDFAVYNSSISTCGIIRFGAVTDNVGTQIEFHNRPAGGSLTQAMTLDASGNLGIGTTSPAQKLHVVVSGGSGSMQIGTSAGASQYQYINFGGNTAGDDAWQVGRSSNSSGLGGDGAFYLYDLKNSTTRLSVTTSGNLGLGVTPSAWSGTVAFQIQRGSINSFSNVDLQISQNTYYDGSNNRYIASSFATTYSQLNGVHSWSTAPSGTAGNAITFTQAMTLDASGRLLVGGTASQGNGSRLQISGSTQYFGSQSANGLLSSTSYFNTNSTGFEIAKLDVSTGANIYEGIFQFYTKDSGGTMAERVRIDSSGNFGIGTSSPSGAFNVVRLAGDNYNRIDRYSTNNGHAPTLEFRTSQQNTIGNTATTIGNVFGRLEWYGNNGSAFTRAAYIGATQASSSSTDSDLVVQSGGTIAFQSGGTTERARITSGGDLMVGTTSGSGRVNIQKTISGETIHLSLNSPTEALNDTWGINWGTPNYNRAAIYGTVTNAGNGSGALLFYTNGSTTNAERARITAGGDLLIAKTSTSTNTVGVEAQANGFVASTRSGSDNTTETFYVYSTGAAAARFYVGMDGTVNATNNTITAISDQRLKENIRDIDAGLDKVMALKPRTFDWKAGKGKDIKNDRGWIAQEFEQVFPDMISEWKDPAPEGEEPYKSVRADLIPVLVKAMQEQQAMINELKAKVAALEA